MPKPPFAATVFVPDSTLDVQRKLKISRPA
jgi:hypothetical protein